MIPFFLATVLLVSPAFAQSSTPKARSAIAAETKALAGCHVQRENAQTVYSEESMLLVLPYEGCGGGNNWGQSVVLLQQWDGKQWKVRMELPYINVETVTYRKGAFIIDWTDYGPDDARCCPSVKRQNSVKAP